MLGGVVAGHLYRDTERRRVGVRTGLIGGPAWFRVAAGGMGVLTMLLFTLLAFALAAVAGVVGAVVGDWLSRKTGRRRASPTDG